MASFSHLANLALDFDVQSASWHEPFAQLKEKGALLQATVRSVSLRYILWQWLSAAGAAIVTAFKILFCVDGTCDA